MKFNIFSKKKKRNKGASLQATDFLNPRDDSPSNLDEDNKTSAKKKKKENKVSKKELKRAEKKKKTEEKKAKKEKEEEKKKSKEEQKNKNSKDKSLKEEENKNKQNEDVKKDEDKEKKDKEIKELQNKETLEQKKQVVEDVEEDKQGTSNHEFEKSNILEINLVKDEINVYFDWYKNIALLIVFLFLSFILVTEIYLALSWWEDKNNSVVSQEETRFIELSEETKEIRNEAKEALNFQTKLDRANYVLDNHLYWSNFFDYLEKNTLENVQYLAFEGDILGNFSIPAVSDNFPSLGQQAYQLQSDSNTLKVGISSAEKLESKEENVDQVEFEIDLKVSPELFKK
jgi:hypothetical protein